MGNRLLLAVRLRADGALGQQQIKIQRLRPVVFIKACHGKGKAKTLTSNHPIAGHPLTQDMHGHIFGIRQ